MPKGYPRKKPKSSSSTAPYFRPFVPAFSNENTRRGYRLRHFHLNFDSYLSFIAPEITAYKSHIESIESSPWFLRYKQDFPSEFNIIPDPVNPTALTIELSKTKKAPVMEFKRRERKYRTFDQKLNDAMNTPRHATISKSIVNRKAITRYIVNLFANNPPDLSPDTVSTIEEILLLILERIVLNSRSIATVNPMHYSNNIRITRDDVIKALKNCGLTQYNPDKFK